MWPDNRLTGLLEIEHPIVQAPMLGSAYPVLAACVSNAGGLGSLACGELPADNIRRLADEMRSASNRPFNMNFFVRNTLPSASRGAIEIATGKLSRFYHELDIGEVPNDLPEPSLAFDQASAELVAEIGPPVVSFHFGVPEPAAIETLKKAGIKLMSSATNVAEAVALVDAGMDAVIAQGWEAGGHRGSHRPTKPGEGIGTMALIPQVVDAVSVPVIAAGGIGDARGIAAAFALGASGVQIGTAFLSCPEAATDPRRRELLKRASDADTMVTDAVSGRSARAVKSPYAEAMAPVAGELPEFPLMYALAGPALEASRERGSDLVSFHLYGQAAALNVELPAAELVEKFVDESAEIFERLHN